MKKYVLLTASVALASPLLMAQSNTADKAESTKQTTQQTLPSSGDSPVDLQAPSTNDEGQTSGAARAGGNSVGATGNPNTKSAKTRTRSSNASDFGTLDANSDGKISQDELKVNTQLGAKFKEGDSNSDGALSRAEFAKLQGPIGKNDTGRDQTGLGDAQKQERTEGSDRTDKDDQLNRQLPGQ